MSLHPAHPEPVEGHTAQILPFPARIPPPAPIVTYPFLNTVPNPAHPFSARPEPVEGPLTLQLGQRGQWCGVLYIARQLRLEAVDLRTVVAHIRAHIASGGFPQPASSRLRHGAPVTGAAAVTPKSEWLRAAVDAWCALRAAASDPLIHSLSKDRAAQVDATLSARFLVDAGREP